MSALGAKTTRVFQVAAEIAGQTGRGFEPVLFFLCALDAVDPDGAVTPLAARDAAMQRALQDSVTERPEAQPEFERFVAAAFAQATLRGHPVVYPVDVLRACLLVAEDAVAHAFGQSDVRRAFRIDELEDLIPAGVLRDEPVEPIEIEKPSASTGTAAFEVLVSGPGFCDRSNRYPTLAEARQAANILSVRVFGSAMFPVSEPGCAPEAVVVCVPRRLAEATRIDIKEC
jgi:hypothetical protein